MSSLIDKAAIVTGASKGIGSGIAEAMAAAGARVAVHYSSDRKGALIHRMLDFSLEWIGSGQRTVLV